MSFLDFGGTRTLCTLNLGSLRPTLTQQPADLPSCNISHTHAKRGGIFPFFGQGVGLATPGCAPPGAGRIGDSSGLAQVRRPRRNNAPRLGGQRDDERRERGDTERRRIIKVEVTQPDEE